MNDYVVKVAFGPYCVGHRAAFTGLFRERLIRLGFIEPAESKEVAAVLKGPLTPAKTARFEGGTIKLKARDGVR